MQFERMSPVAGLPLRNRLRSSDLKEVEEMHTDDEEEEVEEVWYVAKGRNKEEEKMWNGGNKVFNGDKKMRNEEKKKAFNGDKKMKKNRENETWNSDKKMKKKKENETWNGNNKLKVRKLSTAFFERQKKKEMLMRSHNGGEKMRSGDHDRHRRGNSPLPSSKDKNETKKRIATSTSPAKVKKMRPGDSMPARIGNCGDREKKNTPFLLPKVNKIQTLSHNNKENKRKEASAPFEKERKSAPSIFSKKNKTQTLSMANMGNCGHWEKKSTPSLLPKVNKVQAWSNNNNQNKRKEPTTPFESGRNLRVDEKGKKVGTDDKNKRKKMLGDAKEKVLVVDKEKKREVTPFFKFICNNFKEFLFIPPMIAPKLEDLANDHAYLKDSQGKVSTIRLSMVNGFLAFHDGWADFVSDHLINFGDFLLFEYAGMSTFSVRVFGLDSCERLHFNVKTQGGKGNQKESHVSQDDLVSVSSHSSQNSEGINDHHYVCGQHLRQKEPETTVDAYILNSGKIASSKVAESKNAASETHGMTANTEGDTSRVVSGVGCHRFSAELDNKKRDVATGDCKAKSISPQCSKEKTRISEKILVADASPVAQENDDAIKLTISNAASETHHVPVDTKEDPKVVDTKEDPKVVACGSWRGPSVALDNNLDIGEGKTKSISPTCSNEKKRPEIIIVTDVAHLAQENDRTVNLTFSHHGESRSMMRVSDLEVATPTCMDIHGSDEYLRRKQERNTVHVTVGDKCSYNTKVITNGNVCRKYEAPGAFRCLEKWKKGAMSSRTALDGSGPVRPEERQKMNEQLVGSCDGMGLTPVEQRLGSESTDSFVQPMPDRISRDRISRCGNSMTEMRHSVTGKGATVQFQTEKEQVDIPQKKEVEPVRSILCKQSNNVPERANHAISQIQLSQQEDRKASDCVTPVTLIPKTEVLELDNHSLLKINFQFCIPSITETWLELPKLLSSAVRWKGKQDHNIIVLKDTLERLWPVFYHESPLFVGFTAGWKPFAEANNLQVGDHCELLKELDEEEPVYRVQITKK